MSEVKKPTSDIIYDSLSMFVFLEIEIVTGPGFRENVNGISGFCRKFNGISGF